MPPVPAAAAPSLARTRPFRAAALVVVPTAAVTALGLGPVLVWRDRLPDPVASHWGVSGGPDGSMSLGALTAMTAAPAALTLAVLVWSVVGRHRNTFVAPMAVLIALCTTGIGAAAGGSIVRVNLDLVDWREAGPLPGGHVVAVLVAGLALAGLTTRAVASALPPVPTSPEAAGSGRPDALPLAADEPAQWQRSMANNWLLVPSGLLGVFGLAWLVVGPLRWAGAGLVVLGVVTSALARVRVTVDRRGLQVAYGLLNWPRTRIGADRIERADVIEVHPSQWGGWGYRGSLRLFKRAAVVLRRSPGIHLRLRNGAEFAVTVPDPDGGAELLNRVVASTGR